MAKVATVSVAGFPAKVAKERTVLAHSDVASQVVRIDEDVTGSAARARAKVSQRHNVKENALAQMIAVGQPWAFTKDLDSSLSPAMPSTIQEARGQVLASCDKCSSRWHNVKDCPVNKAANRKGYLV